jgi:hypothetical protein
MDEQRLQAFSQKWLSQWPEQHILNHFVAQSKQHTMLAWGALLFELHECVFALEHASVREQKALWWAQELHLMQQQSARHPITQGLQRFSSVFGELAEPVLQLAQQAPIRASNSDDLCQRLQPLAEAILLIEQQLFVGDGVSSADAVIAQCLLMRLPHGIQAFDRALIPMHLLARYQSLDQLRDERALLRDWLNEISVMIPERHSGNGFREAQTRFTQRRIRRLLAHKSLGVQPGHAWDAWRALRTHQSI